MYWIRVTNGYHVLSVERVPRFNMIKPCYVPSVAAATIKQFMNSNNGWMARILSKPDEDSDDDAQQLFDDIGKAKTWCEVTLKLMGAQ